MSETKRQDTNEAYLNGQKIGKGTLQARDPDGKAVSVKLDGKIYVNGRPA